MDISDRVKALCEVKGISVRKLEQSLGIANATIRRWGKVMPNAQTLQDTAQYFGVTVGYLLGESDDPSAEYYIDPEVQAITQELKDRPELKVLFDASKDLKKEDIELVLNMIKRMK